MSSTRKTKEIELTDDAATRVAALGRLRMQRSRGRRNEVTIGARFLALKNSGDVTQAEYDYVMGFCDTLTPSSKVGN